MKIKDLIARLKDSKKQEQEHLSQALRESEAKYKALVENSQDSIMIIRDNKLLFANSSYCRLLGYEYAELLEMPSIEPILPEDRFKALNIAERRKSNDFSTIKDNIRIFTKEGKIRECECIATVIEYNGVSASFMTLHDITESKLMQDALAKSERRFRELTEMLPQAVYELDENNTPTFMNKTGREMFLMGNMTFEKNKAYDFFSAEDTTRMKKALSLEIQKNKIEEIEGISSITKPTEYTACRSDGTTFPVIIYGAPIFENGAITGSRGIIVDISERKAMENALRESETKYKMLVENSQDGILMIQIDLIKYVNSTICKMLEYSHDEIINRSVFDFIEPSYLVKGKDLLQRRMDGERATINMDFHFRNKSGQIIEAETISSILEFNGERVAFFTIHDLTERNRMQARLTESERKYRELVDFMPQTLYELDKNFCLVYINKTGMEQYGLTQEEFGKFSPEYFVSEDVDKMHNNLVNLIEGKSPEIICEYTAVSKKRQKIPILTYSVPIYHNSEITGIRGIIIDISDRKAVEQALRESEEKYRTLVNNANDGIILAQNGRLKLTNKAMRDILQYTEKDFHDKPFYDFVVQEDRNEMAGYHNRRMEGEQFTILYRSRLIRKDGEIITVELNARTLTYNNKPAAFIVVRDISERIAIENELKAAKKQLEILNKNLESRVEESSKKLAETHMQLVNLQKENIQSQFDVLRQQVNPHFLFNSLNVLTSLIKIEPDLAEQFSEHLSKVYRYVLENKDDELVTLSTELRFLDAYVFLLNIRFVGKIHVNINIPHEKESSKIVPLAMQLLIENAIKHNTMSKSNPLIINIYIDEENYLNIINNLQERPSQIISTGVGLKNIENRYQLLNNTKPQFFKTETQFVAKVPLLD
jgi:PAS domain S-box-containing protein